DGEEAAAEAQARRQGPDHGDLVPLPLPLGARPGDHGGCGERSGGCERRARFSLLRRRTPGARPARRTASVVAAFAALAPRLVRLARHAYPGGLLACPMRHVLSFPVGYDTG